VQKFCDGGVAELYARYDFIFHNWTGTGKTVTLVEAIMQVNKLDKNSRCVYDDE